MRETMSTPTREERCVATPLALDLTWCDGEIVRLRLSWAGEKTPELSTPEATALQAALARYVAGETPDWPTLPLRFAGLSDFARRVVETLVHVPRGQKVSYGWLAAKAGNPRAARAVGRVMANNPFPLLVPCHRVVGASGALTGFGPGLEMKEYLLRREGADEQ